MLRLKKLSAFLSILLLAVPFARATEITKGPYLQQLTPAGVTVTWEADKPGKAFVELAPGSQEARRIPAEGSQALRKVRVEGLHPAAAYAYRVVDGDAASASYTFTTMPETGAFTFAVYGDSRTNPHEHAEVADAIARHRPLFVVHVGDFIENADQPSEWKTQFFRPAAGMLAEVPIFAAIGNHEMESPAFYQYLGGPTGKPWYSFDCVNAHFTILDSCLDVKQGSEQHKWLESDLASTDKRWRFVAFHHPVYSSGEHGGEERLRAALEPVFQKYNVDIVLTGHDHIYERTFPIGSVISRVHPVTYVVAGGGGAPKMSAPGDFFTAKAFAGLNFCIISIDGDALDFRAHKVDDEELDGFRIVKSGDGYANGYGRKTIAMERAQMESAVVAALVRKELTRVEAKRTENVSFEFAAPSWGPLRLDIEWRGGDVRISPTTFQTRIAAGDKASASFSLELEPSSVQFPIAKVTGETSLGEFDLQIEPFAFKREDK